MSNISDTIKRTLSMHDVARYYGYEPNRAGSVRCMFHADKTASMKIYTEPGRGWHCYGCGCGGSVIDFVMQLFGLSFKDACVRLNSDFRLGLTDDKPDAAAVAQRRRERDEAEKRRAAYVAEYERQTERHRRLWAAKIAGIEHPDYGEACRDLAGLDWWFYTHPWKDR